MRVTNKNTDVSLAEFVDLITRPGSQPTLAALIDQLFGYSLAGSYLSTEISAPTGQVIALRDLYQMIQQDAGRRTRLAKAVRSVHQ